MSSWRREWRRAWPVIWEGIQALVVFWGFLITVLTVLLTIPSWTSYVDGKVSDLECKQERRVWASYEDVGYQGALEQ